MHFVRIIDIYAEATIFLIIKIATCVEVNIRICHLSQHMVKLANYGVCKAVMCDKVTTIIGHLSQHMAEIS